MLLHVLICDDEPAHRTQMEVIITQHIHTEDVEMELILSTGNPLDILDYLEQHPDRRGLYFLDVDLRHEIDGITLGTKIRQIDPFAKIVFVTTHEELAYLTFRQKVKAMDYIVKNRPDEIQTRMIECCLAAQKRYLEENSKDMKFYRVNANGVITNVPYHDILFFETHPNVRERMLLHTAGGKFDFRGIITEVEKDAPEFYRCHKSYIVNSANIVEINKTQRTAAFANGQVVLIAKDKVTALAKLVLKR